MSLEKVKSFFNYASYFIKQNKSEYVAAIIDLLIFIVAICNWQKLIEEKYLVLLLATIFVDYIWQMYSSGTLK